MTDALTGRKHHLSAAAEVIPHKVPLAAPDVAVNVAVAVTR